MAGERALAAWGRWRQCLWRNAAAAGLWRNAAAAGRCERRRTRSSRGGPAALPVRGRAAGGRTATSHPCPAPDSPTPTPSPPSRWPRPGRGLGVRRASAGTAGRGHGGSGRAGARISRAARPTAARRGCSAALARRPGRVDDDDRLRTRPFPWPPLPTPAADLLSSGRQGERPGPGGVGGRAAGALRACTGPWARGRGPGRTDTPRGARYHPPAGGSRLLDATQRQPWWAGARAGPRAGAAAAGGRRAQPSARRGAAWRARTRAACGGPRHCAPGPAPRPRRCQAAACRCGCLEGPAPAAGPAPPPLTDPVRPLHARRSRACFSRWRAGRRSGTRPAWGRGCATTGCATTTSMTPSWTWWGGGLGWGGGGWGGMGGRGVGRGGVGGARVEAGAQARRLRKESACRGPRAAAGGGAAAESLRAEPPRPWRAREPPPPPTHPPRPGRRRGAAAAAGGRRRRAQPAPEARYGSQHEAREAAQGAAGEADAV
jgi:hypothetical protein